MSSVLWAATFEGCVLGFGLAFLVGPAFFALLQASIDYGFRVSVAIAAGVVCSDMLLMAISYLTMNELSSLPGFSTGLSAVGGIVLIVSGITTIFKKKEERPTIRFSYKDAGKLFAKGFAINTFNPFPWMFWLSTSALVAATYGNYSRVAPVLFFASAAITVFSTDVLKAWVAQFLLKFLTPHILGYFQWVSGVCLAGFGVKLLWGIWH